MLIEEGSLSLSIKAAFGTEWNPKLKLSVGEGIAGDVLKIGKAELLNNVLIDPRYKSGASHIKLVLCATLKLQKRNFGVINLSKSTEKIFTLDDLKLLHPVLHTVAIENAKNFSRLKNATEFIQHATLLDM